MGEDKGGAGDVADSAGAGGDVLEGAPPLGEQRKPAFAEAAQRALEGIVGAGVNVEVPRARSLMYPVQERRWIVGRIPPYGGAMSDHSEAPVVPVEAYEPPYYVAVFTTVRTQDQSGYSETNARMEDLVKDVPGFLGMDHAQTPGGLGITVGYFRDADALTEWCMWRKWSGATRSGERRSPQSPTAG
jgi:heme-degrading monooxygenase HmoA